MPRLRNDSAVMLAPAIIQCSGQVDGMLMTDHYISAARLAALGTTDRDHRKTQHFLQSQAHLLKKVVPGVAAV